MTGKTNLIQKRVSCAWYSGSTWIFQSDVPPQKFSLRSLYKHLFLHDYSISDLTFSCNTINDVLFPCNQIDVC
jgi:hypothetical protein